MIAEIVFFDLPSGISRDELTEMYNTTTTKWASNEDLVEKYYFFDKEKSLGGGVYIWKTREAATRWHGREYQEMVERVYGSPPRIQILEALIRVDAVCGEIHHFD